MTKLSKHPVFTARETITPIGFKWSVLTEVFITLTLNSRLYGNDNIQKLHLIDVSPLNEHYF